MNREHVILNINGLIKKIQELNIRLLSVEEKVSSLDLDTQLMYIRLLYDSYISLEQFVKTEDDASVQDSDVLKYDATLPLLFAEEENEVPDKKHKEALVEHGEENNISEKREKKSETEVIEKGKEEIPEEIISKKKKEKEISENERKKLYESEVFSTSNVPEVDLDTLNDDIPEIDLDAIEFEEVDEEEDDFEKPDSSVASGKGNMEDDISTYYPGINPAAMKGESETGVPVYSGKHRETLGEHFLNQFPSLNDQLSQKKGDSSLGDRLQKRQHITDLNKSIDLNVKFMFIRDLFKGDATLLTKELNNLNKCRRLEEALAYLEKLKNLHNWEEENKAVQSLYELVLRKYANK